MTERKRSKPPAETFTSAEAQPPESGDDAERMLGRVVAIGLPVASVAGAILVGFLASVGSGLLVLASGALLGTIALLWASVRTLSGDAPLPADLEALAGQTHEVDQLGEQKRRVLRALKDLEGERALGKIDDADYESIAMQYRLEAKALMREMDRNGAPSLAEAERVAAAYLASKGLGPAANGVAKVDAARSSGTRERLACPDCETSNEPDAAFCKKCGSAMKSAQEKKLDATS
jgi:hypothetical protein